MFERFRNGSRNRAGTMPSPAIRALEARFVFDGAAAPAAAQAHADAAAQSHGDQAERIADTSHAEPADKQTAAPAAGGAPGTETASTNGRHEIVVIDRGVADLQTLLAGVPASAEVILIDSGRDGFDQLADALAGRSGIDAIHILSHGSAGDLHLGTGELTADSIQGRYASDLAIIGKALTATGDLLIYGCDFAAGEAGARAAALLAQATGADVAASDDATGDAALGGDWDLEVHDGAIETGVVVSETARHEWHHLLATLTINVSGDPVVKDGQSNTISTTRAGNGVNYLDVNNNVVGSTAFWASVGMVGGVNVSLRATVVAVGESDDAVSFATSASGGDAVVLVRAQQTASPAANQAGSVTIRWDLVRADDPSVAVMADIDLRIGDIDGAGGQPNTRESVTPLQTGLTSYTLATTTDLVVDTSNDRIRVSGTQNETASPPDSVSIVRFDWTNVSTWQVKYDLAANATTGSAAFQHDGDGGLIITNPVTKTIPKVDLDANDSSGATGNDYRTSYTEKGSAVAVADTDPLVTNTAATVSSATVVLTNAQAGDRLNIGTLPGGLTATPSTGSGTITVTLSGDASPATYQAALQAITFDNTSSDPATADRIIRTHVTSDGVQGTSSITTVSVTAVNDAPINGVPSAQSVNEDTNLVFSSGNSNAIAIADVDAGNGSLTTTLSVLHGMLTLGGTANVTASGSGTGSVTLSGTVANINAALNGTIYRANPNYNGADTLTITTDDGGNTGSGGPHSDGDTIALTVRPVVDAPVNTVPAGPQGATEDTALIFSASNGNPIRVDDPDGGTLTVTLSTTQGLLTLSRTTGLSFATGDGSADAGMTFTGAIADINAALDGLRFVPNADYNGNTQISLSTQDPIRTADTFANGGFEQPARPANTFAFVDDSSVPGWRTTASDHKIEIWTTGYQGVPAYEGNQFAEINATEVAALYQDFNTAAGSTISLDFAHRGRLGTDTMEVKVTDLGADGIAGTGDDTTLFQKSYSDGNTAWGAHHELLSQTSSGNTLRFEFRSVSAAGGDPGVGNFVDGIAISQNFRVSSIVNVAIAPVADIVPDSVQTDEDTPVTFNALTGTNGASADSFKSPSAVVTSVTQGSHGSVSFLPDGTLTYTPAANFNGGDSFTYTVTSGGTTETATVTVTVRPVNDAPVNGMPANQSVNEDTPLVFSTGNGNRITVADPDAWTGPVTTTLSVLHGTLTLGSSSGVTVSNDGTGSVTLTGTVSAINAALNGTRYLGAADYNGTDTLTVTTNDNGNTGSGGAKSDTDAIALTVAPVNDAPRAGILPTLGSLDGDAVAGADLGRYFSDVEGDAIRFTSAGLPVGLAINPATGIVSGTIGRSASRGGTNGDYAVTITADDGHGGLTSRSFTWRVVNPAPIARDDGAVVDAATPITGSVLADNGNGADSDPDGDLLAVAAVNGAAGNVGQSVAGSAGGRFTVLADGRFRFDPGGDFTNLAAGQTRTTLITYTLSDGDGGLAEASFAVTVTGLNEPPTALTPSDRAAADGQSVALPLGSLFSDPDGEALGFSATGLPPGLSIDPATGALTGTIDHAASGPAGLADYRITITATDPHGATAARGFTLRVTNPAPRAADDRATAVEEMPATIDVLANDTDPDGDTLSIVAAGDAAPRAGHGRVTVVNGRLAYTPDANFNGTDTITYMIADGNGGTSTASVFVTVTPQNDAPDAGTLPDQSGRHGSSVSYDISGRFHDADTDPSVAQAPTGDSLSFSATGLPPGLSIDPATGLITGTLPSDVSAGPRYAVTITATDASGASVARGFTWTVTNDAPITAPDTATTREDSPVLVTVAANDTDPDGDAIHLVDEPGAASAAHGSVTVDPATGLLAYTPDPGFNGRDTIVYTIEDAQGARATGILTVTVTPVNDRPVASETLPGRSGADGESVRVPLGNLITDPDGDPLAYSVAGLPPGLTIDPATGEITGTIDHAASGPSGRASYVVTLTATDPDGLAVSRNFSWTVTNPAPSAVDDAIATAEDTPVDIDVTSNDTDPDGDTLVVVPGSMAAAHGSVTLNPDGSLRYVPERSFNGTDHIVYTISDGNGGFATASAMITVTPVNDAPAVDPSSPVLADRTANDSATVLIPAASAFGDIDSGDRLSFSATGLPPGLTVDAATGLISGTLASDASSRAPGGVYTIALTATDLAGATATTRLTITAANPAPIAGDDDATLDEDTVLTGSVLGNDGDPDGDAIQVEPVPVAGPAHGRLDLRPDGSFTYTPDADFHGADAFTYALVDSDGGRSTATVHLTVSSVNDAPMASVAPVTTREDMPVDGSIVASDRDGDPLTYTVETPPGAGTLTLRPDGSFTYTPGPDRNGSDSFVVRVSDGQGGSVLVSVPVTVAPVNDAPDAHADPLTLPANTSAKGSVVATDRDGDPLRFRLTGQPTNGTVVLASDGTYSYTPHAAYSGADRFTVEVGDGQGGLTLVTVDVTITPNPVQVPPGALVSILAPSQAFTDRPSAVPVMPPVSSIAAEGFILPALAEIDSLGSIGDVVLADGAVVAAVNGVASLHGTAMIPDHPVMLDEADRIARLSWERFERAPIDDTPWFSPRPYLGRSLGFSLTTGDLGTRSNDLMVEAIRRPDTLAINLRNSVPGLAAMAEVRLLGIDGAPRPAWIEGDGRGSFWGRPPAGTGIVAIELEVVLEDGTVVRRALTVDAETGEVRALPNLRRPVDSQPARSREPEAAPRTEAPLFTAQLAALEMRGARDLTLIERALSRDR